MITKITSENTAKYQALFEKVSEILKLEPAISTLGEYFQHLNEISQKDPSLIILPLDEEKFSIDGNSRKIVIPQAFTKNGIGVQGDHYAEYIYFEIDRYFENIDFGSPSITAIVEFVDANQQKHFTKAWIKYADNTDVEHPKIIIGWPITQDVTSKAGSIKFSVRLFELNAGDNSYKRSFGTLIGQLVVNPSLDFAISKAEIDNIQGDLNQDVEKNVLDRIIDSPAADYSVDQVVSPVFLFRYKNKEETKPDGSCDADAGDVLMVQAIAPGSVTYSWYKEKGEKTTNIDTGIETVYKQLGEFKENIPIYENKSIDGTPKYRLADVSKETFAEGGPYYERYSKYTLPDSTKNDITGTYYCVAQNNMYGFSRSSNQKLNIPKGWTEADCKIGNVTVPGPTPFDKLTYLEKKKEISNGGSLTVGAGGATPKDNDRYTWSFKGENGTVENFEITGNTCNLLNAEGTYSVSVARTRNGAVSEPVDLGSCYAYRKPQPVEFVKVNGKPVDKTQSKTNYSIPQTPNASCVIEVQTNGKFESYKVDWFVDKSPATDVSATNLNATVSEPDENGVFTISFNPNKINSGLYYPVVTVSKSKEELADVAPEICSFEDIGYLVVTAAETSG